MPRFHIFVIPSLPEDLARETPLEESLVAPFACEEKGKVWEGRVVVIPFS